MWTWRNSESRDNFTAMMEGFPEDASLPALFLWIMESVFEYGTPYSRKATNGDCHKYLAITNLVLVPFSHLVSWGWTLAAGNEMSPSSRKRDYGRSGGQCLELLGFVRQW
ncbi:hypothetical protein BV22DRAFT_1043205 [Leucogyrophana mollusca]|uniref:Uncharacterized protein n=1 Tax=Leucogyrophana mollusca TaxID=85980 RepID=A0ACB8BY41_9AGAM|nr:hypothetical protein BV22DRAFT_1043205 [Leucogyrophana mollusca]